MKFDISSSVIHENTKSYAEQIWSGSMHRQNVSQIGCFIKMFESKTVNNVINS